MLYLRDGRSPIPKKEATSRVMSANRYRDTGPELVFRRALCGRGFRGYRLNWKKAPGRPDIAFPGRKIAVFLNGCYWHRCMECKFPLPKSNRKFWMAKFRRNRARDGRKVRELESRGWEVLTFWEHEIKNDVSKCASKVSSLVRCADGRG